MASSVPRTLRVVVLPTLHNKSVFHPRFLTPMPNKFEKAAIIGAYVLRKWRYAVSDIFAYHWHAFGSTALQQPHGLAGRVYRWASLATTRRASGEYLLKMIPLQTEKFVYPPSSDVGAIKQHLNSHMQASDKHLVSLFLWSLVFPLDFYIAKFFVVAANLLFVYNSFRVVSSFRAVMGARVLKRLVEEGSVEFVPSRDVENDVLEIVNRSGGVVDTVAGDLSDDVVEECERKWRCVELARTYRRARFQYWLHGGKD
ncbi:hypothetical protein SeMB42_g01342 [Synchytrium endobioticum]|uniref:Uncharacterized protein n=1 Tax=Synchytrium endobioticum TaxID=286115 RepID=A0A507DNW2_9FUNG|nr:hypothetical protein SeMB42_g01342 [Synchytrium endobioticum]